MAKNSDVYQEITYVYCVQSKWNKIINICIGTGVFKNIYPKNVSI